MCDQKSMIVCVAAIGQFFVKGVFCCALTFTEHEVRCDVKGLDLDVIHGNGDALLVVT